MKTLTLSLILLFFQSCTFDGFFYNTDYAKEFTIEQSKIENVEEFHLENTDGISIHAAFIKSKEKEVKGSVFMLHGNSGPISTWLGMSEMYTRQGYNFYIMDYQGFGMSEGKPTHENIMTDAQMAFNHFLSLDYVKNTKIIIHGISIGGHLSVKLTENNQSKINALVLDEVFSTHRKTARHNAPFLLKPFAYLLISNEYPALKSIEKIIIPTLFIASNEDNVAPIKFSKELFIKCNSVKKELWNVGGEHMQGLYPNRKEYIEKLNKLIN